jgi:beta-carotene hydroxylase
MVPAMREAQLRKQERHIARKYADRFPWEVLVWGFGNLIIWLSLWPLVFFDLLPLWLAFPIATINVMACFLPSHEAVHGMIARPGKNLRWLNEWLGHLSLIPMAMPSRIHKYTHLEHHKHVNHPELDPDITTQSNGPWHAIWQSIVQRQRGKGGALRGYGFVLERIGRSDVLVDGALYQLTFFAILFVCAWNGYALEAALLWWLPRHIGMTYIQFFFSWAPHHPAEKLGRYSNARFFKSKIGNIASMGMQYHLIHHLYPYIPLTDTPRAFREMRPLLEERGCRFEGDLQ